LGAESNHVARQLHREHAERRRPDSHQEFYDDVAPITPAERRAIADIPAIDSAMRVEVQLGATEAKNAALVERIMQPR
jgi:hypothetical protein